MREHIKGAVVWGCSKALNEMPLSVQVQNKLIKTVPPTYKQIITILLLNETENPISTLADKIMQLADLGDWQTTENSPGREKRKTFFKKDKMTRGDMFLALLLAGVPKDQIDGVDTKELWKLYKEKGLNVKQVNRRDSIKNASNPVPTAPSAPPPPSDPLFVDLRD